MLSFPVGIFGFLCIIYYSFEKSSFSIFLNGHALLIVVGGTVMILATANPLEIIWSFSKNFRKVFSRQAKDEEINDVLIKLSKDKGSQSGLKIDPLISYTMNLWEQGLDQDTIVILMKQKMDQLNQESASAVTLLRNLAKYPPALGMTGTVIGLIHLFGNLTKDSQDQIGPSLALAMTATFYGLILSNAILMPFGDRLQIIHQQSSKRNKFIFQILCLIQEEQPSLVVREEVYGKSA